MGIVDVQKLLFMILV